MVSITTTTLSGTCRSSLAICPRGAFLAAFLLITLYLSGLPGVAHASEPVDRTLVGCVVEGRFFSLGSAHFERDLNKAEEIYQGLVSADRLSRAYPIMLFSDENYLHELDLSRYESKALGMKGSLLPGNIFFISDTDSLIVLRDSCHEHLLTFIQQRIDPDFLPPDTTSDTQADVQQTTTGTHAASELESLDRITVRALRGWGHLPPKFDRLALDLRGKGIDILGFDHEQVQELARQASAPDSPLQAQGADLKELAEFMAGFLFTQPEIQVQDKKSIDETTTPIADAMPFTLSLPDHWLVISYPEGDIFARLGDGAAPLSFISIGAWDVHQDPEFQKEVIDSFEQTVAGQSTELYISQFYEQIWEKNYQSWSFVLNLDGLPWSFILAQQIDTEPSLEAIFKMLIDNLAMGKDMER